MKRMLLTLVAILSMGDRVLPAGAEGVNAAIEAVTRPGKTPGQKAQLLVDAAKDLADKKKSIFNEDLEAIVADSVIREDDRYSVKDVTVLSGTFAKPTATVELEVDGESAKATALGVGPVDAVFKAIAELTETKSDLLRFQVNAVTGGLDAQGARTELSLVNLDQPIPGVVGSLAG